MTEQRRATAAEEPTPDRGSAQAAWDEWDVGGPPPRAGRIDLSPLLVLLEALRRAVPAELQQQFNALVRELLLALRALIDWYLERLDSGPPRPPVEDIPID